MTICLEMRMFFENNSTFFNEKSSSLFFDSTKGYIFVFDRDSFSIYIKSSKSSNKMKMRIPINIRTKSMDNRKNSRLNTKSLLEEIENNFESLLSN